MFFIKFEEKIIIITSYLVKKLANCLEKENITGLF